MLGKAEQAHRKQTTLIMVAEQGQGAALEKQVTDLGGVVSSSARPIGYVRASVSTTDVEKFAKLAALRALDLDETFRVPEPEPSDRTKLDNRMSAQAVQPAPGINTPAANPYLPTDDTGSVRFKKQHPEWDGRGVTIGVVDSGVSLDNPALLTTSTGERKIVDWVTGTDPVADQDGTWREMRTAVSGPAFTAQAQLWTAPAGTYQVLVDGYSVPTGTTSYDYRDVFYTPAFGSLDVPNTPVSLIQGQTGVIEGTLRAIGSPGAGRQLFGQLDVVSEQGTVVGSGLVVTE